MHKSTKTLSIQHPIIYRGKKIAAEVAASVKNFLISIYRISEVIKRKSVAALSTIAATFCSIIIETLYTESHRKPTEVPQISYGGRLICKTLSLYQRYTKGIQRAGAMEYGCPFTIYFSQIWHISCTFQKKTLPLHPI